MMTNIKLEKANISHELKLILDLLSFNKPIDDLELKMEGYKDIDWSHFLKLTAHHRVYPIIYPLLKEVKQLIPAKILGELYLLYQRNTIHMLRLSGEMEFLNKLFRESFIRFIFLKGPILAKELYGDISLRTSSDIDMLVPITDLTRVDDLLVRQGYVKDDYIKTVLNDWKWRHHHVTYLNKDHGIKVEVHWRLNPGPGREPSFEELWKRKSLCRLSSTPMYRLGYEDLFMFLSLHGARHGWSRLRWLDDMKRLLNKALNVDFLYMQLRKFNYTHIGGQSLILVRDLLNTDITKQLENQLICGRSLKLANESLFYIGRMVNLHADNLTKEVSQFHKRYLFHLMPLQQKAYFVLSYLFPYPEDAEILPLPKKLHVLYFPLRPVLWLWRKSRKQVISRGTIK